MVAIDIHATASDNNTAADALFLNSHFEYARDVWEKNIALYEEHTSNDEELGCYTPYICSLNGLYNVHTVLGNQTKAKEYFEKMIKYGGKPHLFLADHKD
jgi:tetratricopeptide (TPR) repeat protein